MPKKNPFEVSPRYAVGEVKRFGLLPAAAAAPVPAAPEREEAVVTQPEKAVPHAIVPQPFAPAVTKPEAPSVGEAGKELEGAEPKEEKLERRAVWIVHGMGQQIPFETVDSLTEGILSAVSRKFEKLKYEASAKEVADLTPTAHAVKIGEQTLQCVQIVLPEKVSPTGKKYELHLFEAYWAPLTEGVAKLRDVVSFLFDGGTRGILNCIRPFKLAMFDRVCSFKIPKRSAIFLGVILLLLLSLIVLNLVIVGATGAKLKIFSSSIPISDSEWKLLAAFGSSASTIAISFGVLLFLAELSKSPNLSAASRLGYEIVSWVGTIGTAVSLLTCAVFFVVVIMRKGADWYPAANRNELQGFSVLTIIATVAIALLAMVVRAALRSKREKRRAFSESSRLSLLLLGAFIVFIAALAIPVLIFFCPRFAELFANRFPDWATRSWWVWPFLGFVSAQVRTLLVEYPGDVAIYITPNKVDRFDKVRQEIKDVALKSAKAVYGAADGDKPAYTKVAIVGHSLGSVIAYDTLNKLMSDDQLSGGGLKASERTCVLETFGSPLDKVAFAFTIQGKDSFQIRSQLVEAVRPMIHSFACRKFPWVNVRSRNDIISGPLTFYDLPDPTKTGCGCDRPNGMPTDAERVSDVVDEDAAVALVAHVDYWKNERVWEELLERVAP